MDKKASWALAGAVWFMAVGLVVLGWVALDRLAPVKENKAEIFSLKNICPVSRKKVVLNEETSKVKYKGREYVFSQGRDSRGRTYRTLFIMDPDKYLADDYVPEKTDEDLASGKGD